MKRSSNASENYFRCVQCHNQVPVIRLLSGVQNRNHCPYCLWSRHLDLHRAGDRMAACKAPMRPIGLAFKKENKRYGPTDQGEILLIHCCTDCGRISINRIAADDNTEKILELFHDFTVLSNEMKMQMRQFDITPLTSEQYGQLCRSLLGQEIPG